MLVLYLGWLCRNTLSVTVGSGQGSRTITVATVRGTIYDRQMRPLVNAEQEYRAAILPDESLLAMVRPAMDTSSYLSLLDKVSAGEPAVVRLNKPAAVARGLSLFLVPVRYGQRMMAPHIIGYLDASAQHGVTGLEYAYNEILSACQGRAEASFAVNGAGAYLAGEAPTLKNTVANAAGGVVTTLDRDIQEIVEEVAKTSLLKGAVVVLDPQNGAVLASSSVPTYHPETVADSIEKADGALINRALALYDCGSVFKIVTAAAALENRIPVGRTYTCNGSMTVGNTVFHCHERRLGHQTLAMDEAFASSCNLYFIQLAQEVGAEKLLKMTEKLGLTQKLKLADGIEAPACVLPTIDELTTPAALANFAFGQGKLLLSPLHVARMTAAVTNDGILPSLTLVTATINNAWERTEIPQGRGGERAFSSLTANTLKKMLEMVVTDGTGRKATLNGETSAGKTGTAQTGQQNGDVPVIQSWFTGYFPADEPRYVISVIAEDSDSNRTNATACFCEISNKLIEKEREQTD